jgi:hypothetical protein
MKRIALLLLISLALAPSAQAVQKKIAVKNQLIKKPEEVLRKAILGMLPKNNLRYMIANNISFISFSISTMCSIAYFIIES